MAKLPEPENTTRNAIFKWWRAQRGDAGFREHLGGSIIGRNCTRAIWYSWRWGTVSRFEGRKLRLFDRGDLEEARFIKELQGIGCEVVSLDPFTNDQLRVSDLGGHFGGSLDAEVRGLPEAPKTWHVAEFKTHNDKSFKALVKDGVLKSKPEHYAQMQVYMGKRQRDRAIYIAANKNDDDLYIERVEFSKKDYDQLIERARMIIATDRPPAKISEDPSFYLCHPGFCDHATICHSTAVPPPTCRSCMHSTPEMDGDGRWSCAMHEMDLTKDMQLNGCAYHVYLPHLLESWAKVTDAFDVNVEYENLANGKKFNNGRPGSISSATVYTSAEIYQADDKRMIGDDMVETLKHEFDARIAAEASPEDTY
jgi:hypothetical protein